MMAFLRDRFLVGCVTLVVIVLIAGAVFLDETGKGSDVRAVALAVIPSLTSAITLVGLGKRLSEKPSTDQVRQASKEATTEVINGQIKQAVKDAVNDNMNP